MGSPTKDHSRADRLREFDALLATTEVAVGALGVVVRAREARGWTQPEPPEVAFAAAVEDGFPAAVWVALRRDDVPAALEVMTALSQTTFLISEREEMGAGYRLQTVAETRVVPDVGLLIQQLAAVLDIPADVLRMLAEWGPDDPRTAQEIDALLDSRSGVAAGASGPQPAAAVAGGLTMTVDETADVLQLSPAQTKVLATLVRRVGVTITP